MKKISAFGPRTTHFGFDPFFNELFDSIKSIDRSFESKGSLPAANIKETDTCYQLSLARPGYAKEQINITIKE